MSFSIAMLDNQKIKKNIRMGVNGLVELADRFVDNTLGSQVPTGM